MQIITRTGSDRQKRDTMNSIAKANAAKKAAAAARFNDRLGMAVQFAQDRAKGRNDRHSIESARRYYFGNK